MHLIDKIIDSIYPPEPQTIPRGFMCPADEPICWIAMYDGRDVTVKIKCECGDLVDAETDGGTVQFDHEGFERLLILEGWENRYPRAKKE